MGDELSALYNVATDYELSILDDLAARAGLNWTHIACWTNPATTERCENCGALISEIPDEELL